MNPFIVVLLFFFAGFLIWCYGLWEDGELGEPLEHQTIARKQRAKTYGESGFRTYGKIVMGWMLIVLLMMLIVSK